MIPAGINSMANSRNNQSLSSSSELNVKIKMTTAIREYMCIAITDVSVQLTRPPSLSHGSSPEMFPH